MAEDLCVSFRWRSYLILSMSFYMCYVHLLPSRAPSLLYWCYVSLLLSRSLALSLNIPLATSFSRVAHFK